ncbi:hypothetical protein BV25DRAFT_279853 [Artomyces pyxidatus]|uniref:Uncharacterized protein n=1 Tax=Artomyces pyxidatus TaxID=48021 RepID=A0ACB8T882_9AGAM|nr:hypothetical protein BV25DRAFT_279853 [Artomyces pyxidatus]
MAPYQPGRVFACLESMHTPARRALELPDVDSRTTYGNMSQWTAPTTVTSDPSKIRPCLILPKWGSYSTAELEVCVMGTFNKARRSELAAVYRHFNIPIFPHTEYGENDIYVKANVQWEKNAWVMAYPFVPTHPLLNPWRVGGVNAEVREVEWLKEYSNYLVEKWKVQIKDTAHLQRLQDNYRFIRGKAARRQKIDRMASQSIHEILENTTVVRAPQQGSRPAPTGDGSCVPLPRSPSRTVSHIYPLASSSVHGIVFFF